MIFLNAFFIAPLLMATVSAHAETPKYVVDLSGLTNGSVIHNGTPAETDAYNTEISDKSKFPVFSQEAFLQLGDRKVRVFLIASTHDGPSDVEYIESQIRHFAIDKRASQLIVEQGDPSAPGGPANLLREMIRERSPHLLDAVARASGNPLSFFDPEFFSKLTFAKIARTWAEAQGHVVDFDLATHYDDQAIGFLRSTLEPQAAIRIMRENITADTFTYGEFQQMLGTVYPKLFDPELIATTPDCCGSSSGWVRNFLADNQVRNIVRERYMRSVLNSTLRDGDVIVTHPVHMRHLLEPEQLP